jgi:GDPmannose 4,6-dehydratase
LQQDQPDDFVIGTGETHSVQEFVETSFAYVDLNWRNHVVIDPKFYRPAEVDLLVADPRKAAAKLDWKPRVNFSELVAMMVEADLAQLSGAADAGPPGESDGDFRVRAA